MSMVTNGCGHDRANSRLHGIREEFEEVFEMTPIRSRSMVYANNAVAGMTFWNGWIIEDNDDDGHDDHDDHDGHDDHEDHDECTAWMR